MALYGWHNCPAEVREQVDGLASRLSQSLAGQIVGIYLHGSLAMGCFNPRRSDLDLLVITTNRMPLDTKRQIVELLLACSRRPQAIEVSFLARDQLRPWHYPTPFDLHYSEMWRASYTNDLAAGGWQAWNDEQRDPDLAAHITIINRRGICLAGTPIAAIFPDVPDQDYRASIMADVHDSLESIAANPVYTILNCCRTYAYVLERHVFSKEEGGRWALQALPAQYRDVVAIALEAYRSDAGEQVFDSDTLAAFVGYMSQILVHLG